MLKDSTTTIVLKTIAGQQSLTITIVFVTAKKLRWATTITTNTLDVTKIYVNLIRLSKPNLLWKCCKDNWEYWGGK